MERSSIIEGEVPGGKMVTEILTRCKSCNFITFLIEYLCNKAALVASSTGFPIITVR